MPEDPQNEDETKDEQPTDGSSGAQGGPGGSSEGSQGETTASGSSERRSSSKILPQVYDELRRIAAHRLSRLRPGQTLQATALVHDAYLRISKTNHPGWKGRPHFLAAASRAMRELLIEQARRKGAVKHGGEMNRVSTSQVVELGADGPLEDVLALDEVLRRLEDVDPRKGRVVHLRYFGGMSTREVAEYLDVSVATVERDWVYARTWLHRELSAQSE